MANLVLLEEFENFRLIRDVAASDLRNPLIDSMRSLDEREELEPFFRLILADEAQTPHGPAEIADIYTHKLSLRGTHGMAAFLLKGRSFPTVRPKHVAHQIYRLEKIHGLAFAVFAAAGTVLDAAKEQFCSTCERLGVRYAFADATDLARLFVAAGFFCPRDGARIVAGRCRCGYSPRNRFLNILQRDALKNLDQTHRIRNPTGIIILPPGSGKTRISAEDAKRFSAESVLYVAHTHEILDVARSEFEAVFGTNAVRRINPPFKSGSLSKVNLTTVQLLAKELTSLPPQTFDYVVIDEFHHAAAKSYRALIDHFRPKFLLGLTATPFRGDRQDIWELCGRNTIANYELRTGIDSGVLVPYHYFGCFDDVDYSKICHSGLNYAVRDLERALLIPERDSAIVKKWQELADGRPSLAFCCSVRHARRVADHFNRAGVSAAAYTSANSYEERINLLKKFTQNLITVLAVVDVMNEGADLPSIECLLFLRPTESKRIFLQQLGRGLRRSVGKAYCIVIDFIGNFQNAYRVVEYHGLIPIDEDDMSNRGFTVRSPKELLDLPLGCEVHFDDRVIDLFTAQGLNPAHPTRHNIGRILIYRYQELKRKLGRAPTRTEIDRFSRLGSDIYVLLFGSWKRFEEEVREMTR